MYIIYIHIYIYIHIFTYMHMRAYTPGPEVGLTLHGFGGSKELGLHDHDDPMAGRQGGRQPGRSYARHIRLRAVPLADWAQPIGGKMSSWLRVTELMAEGCEVFVISVVCQGSATCLDHRLIFCPPNP